MRIVTCDGVPAPVGPYSVGKWAGDYLFVSGQVGMKVSDKGLIGDDVISQMEVILGNLEAILKKETLGWDDVVKTNIYLTNISDFQAINKVYSEALAECQAMPARVCYQVAALPLGAKAEIEVIAYRKEEK